jgi:hypothetical protein
MTAKKMTYAEFLTAAKHLDADWGAAPPIHTVEFIPATTADPSDKLRKVYTKVTQAMAQAKAEGDAERYEALKPQHKTLLEALTAEKAEQSAREADERAALEECFAIAIAQLKAAIQANAAYKDDNDRLRDENQSLRAPLPVEEYKKAQLMHPTMTPPLNAAAFEKAADAIFGSAV